MMDVGGCDDSTDRDEIVGALLEAGRLRPDDQASGPRVDRYVLQSRLARTCGADLFAGCDPATRRSVVVAVLGDSSNHRASLSQIKCLARLAHPNLLSVLDVGMHWGRGFGVFAPVTGCSLGAWLQSPRTTREVLALYLGIAQGLVACDAAQIGAESFSPSSVVVGVGGHARVIELCTGARLPGRIATAERARRFGESLRRALGRGQALNAAHGSSAVPQTFSQWAAALASAVATP